VTSHKQQKLKFVAPTVTVKLPFESVDRLYVGLEHIQSWTGGISLDAESNPEGTVSLFEINDILFGKLRPYLAKVALSKFQGSCSTEALVLRPRPGNWPSYLRYVLSQKQFIEEVDASTYGAKMPRASWEFIGSRVIPTPDLPIQKAIADFLDRETARIDQLIAKKKRFLGLLDEKEFALVSHLLTNGLRVGVPTKPAGVPWLDQIPQHWILARMKDVCQRIIDCKNRTPPEIDESEFFVVRTSCIRSGRFEVGGGLLD
jgi:type I restriction enzyme S subunit